MKHDPGCATRGNADPSMAGGFAGLTGLAGLAFGIAAVAGPGNRAPHEGRRCCEIVPVVGRHKSVHRIQGGPCNGVARRCLPGPAGVAYPWGKMSPVPRKGGPASSAKWEPIPGGSRGFRGSCRQGNGRSRARISGTFGARMPEHRTVLPWYRGEWSYREYAANDDVQAVRQSREGHRHPVPLTALASLPAGDQGRWQ